MNKEASRLKSRRQFDEEYRLAANEATRKHYHKVKYEYRAKFMVRTAKRRAKQLGLDFNLEESDVIVPEVCPILGLELVLNEGKLCAASASLDRIDSSKGYVKGNVWIISHKANAMKNNATAEELIKFALWIQREPWVNYNGEKIDTQVNKKERGNFQEESVSAEGKDEDAAVAGSPGVE